MGDADGAVRRTSTASAATAVHLQPPLVITTHTHAAGLTTVLLPMQATHACTACPSSSPAASSGLTSHSLGSPWLRREAAWCAADAS